MDKVHQLISQLPQQWKPIATFITLSIAIVTSVFFEKRYSIDNETYFKFVERTLDIQDRLGNDTSSFEIREQMSILRNQTFESLLIDNEFTAQKAFLTASISTLFFLSFQTLILFQNMEKKDDSNFLIVLWKVVYHSVSRSLACGIVAVICFFLFPDFLSSYPMFTMFGFFAGAPPRLRKNDIQSVPDKSKST